MFSYNVSFFFLYSIKIQNFSHLFLRNKNVKKSKIFIFPFFFPKNPPFLHKYFDFQKKSEYQKFSFFCFFFAGNIQFFSNFYTFSHKNRQFLYFLYIFFHFFHQNLNLQSFFRKKKTFKKSKIVIFRRFFLKKKPVFFDKSYGKKRKKEDSVMLQFKKINFQKKISFSDFFVGNLSKSNLFLFCNFFRLLDFKKKIWKFYFRYFVSISCPRVLQNPNLKMPNNM